MTMDRKITGSREAFYSNFAQSSEGAIIKSSLSWKCSKLYSPTIWIYPKRSFVIQLDVWQRGIVVPSSSDIILLFQMGSFRS